jgi:hypothetical protein
MSFTGKLLLGVLLCGFPLQVLGWDWRTKVTLILNNQPLLVACQQLEKEYGVHFSYSRDLVDLSRKVTISIRNKPLKKVLAALFDPHDIAYTRIGNQVVLTVKLNAMRTISGYAEDAYTGEKLIGATIYCPAQQTGTVTNQYGFYSLTLKKDTSALVASYVGYNPQRFSPPAGGNRQVMMALQPLNSLQEIVVTENMQHRLQEQTQMSKVNMPASDVKAMPKLLGEADVMRTMLSLPGVTSSSEGLGGLSVRGGSPDQNLILLDGTPVFNAEHIFGIFSVFNPDIVKNADLYKGAFPARYGGRLSSVVDISMKDGDMKEIHGDVSISTIAAKFMVEGPLWKNKTSFVLSARRSYLDILAKPFISEALAEDGESGDVFAFFSDANLRINHIFSPKDRLYFSAFGGEDATDIDIQYDNTSMEDQVPKRYKEKTRFKMGWGNSTATLRWNHVFNERLFSNLTFNYSQYYFLTTYNYEYEALNIEEKSDLYGKYHSRVQNAVGKIDFDYRPNPRHAVKFGIGATTHIFRPGTYFFEDHSDGQSPPDTSYNDFEIVGVEMTGYAEDDWQLTKSLHVNTGLHMAGFLVEKRFYFSVQPRLGLRYLLPDNWALKLAYTHMSQPLHLLVNNGTNMPTDLWVPSTNKVRPMISRQLAVGAAKTTTNNQYEFSLEAYYKTMDNVIEYTENTNIFNSAGKKWDEQVIIGKGRSYGAELLLEKKQGKTRGWLGYTLAWSNRLFPEVNGGQRFPYKYDPRHTLELALVQRLGKHWELSASWQFSTGMPLTLPVASYEGITDPSPWGPDPDPPNRVDELGPRNSIRSGSIHRLDVGFTYTKKKKWWTKSWNFSLFNAYNQKNPYYYYIKTDVATQERFVAQVTLLPILPSITYGIKF